MTKCTMNASGKHCWEEDLPSHKYGGRCCFCSAKRPSALAVGTKAHQDIAAKVHELATARVTPQIHCSVCHVKATRVMVKDHPTPANLLHDYGKVWQNDLNGWMLATFPYNDQLYLNRVDGLGLGRFGAQWDEVAKLCPSCGHKVRSYMAHLAKPMLDDNDL